MEIGRRGIRGFIAVVGLSAASYAATFGTVVPVRGTVSDIALDSRRGNLYIANFSAGRVEVMNTSTLTFGAPFVLSKPPSAIAMSPDNRFLVVGQYDGFGTISASGAVTILDLDAGLQQQISLATPVLSVAFGAGSQALVVTGCGTTTPPPPANGATTTPTVPATDCKSAPGQLLLLDPLSANTQNLGVTALDNKSLPVPLATFPANITKAATGVSGDGHTIIILAETGQGVTSATASGGADQFTILSYQVGDTQVGIFPTTSTPPMGPRVVSVNKDGSSYLFGWYLASALTAQFPYPLADFRSGGHAFDFSRNLIYANVPASATEPPVMSVADTDNLTIREQIQLPEMMAGRTLFSADMNTLYAVSDSGVMVLPVGSLANAPRVVAQQEDVVFQADACNRLSVSQTIDIADPSGGRTDFTLSLPAKTAGIRLSQTSGRTPARIRIDIDPTVFQNAKGTTTIMLGIQSSGGVNIPQPVRLLINTRDFNQRGQIINVPGKIVDVLADPVRNRLYLIRQDKNLVLVYDSTTFTQVATLRTGNTPVGMAITEDYRYLIVGADNSQSASVFDLETLRPSTPISFGASYPHSIAVGHGAIWATARTSFAPQPPLGSQPLYRIDFANRVANAPSGLGIFVNGTPVLDNAVLAASPSLNYILLVEPKGTVAMWDATVDQWVVSRKDFTGLGGAYGALDDNRFVVDNNLLDQSLSPVAQLESSSGGSSGVATAGGGGFRTTAAAAAGPGTLERVDLANLASSNGTATGEAPQLTTSLKTPPIGQIGETILPFTRTLAVPADQSSIVLLTQSGLTVLPPNFDAPTPIPSVTGITNSADGGTGVAPGGLVLISGRGLAPQSAAAGKPPLPSSLGDICVTVSSQAIPLFQVSSTQVLAQLPFTASGDVPLVVHSPGGIGSPFTVHIQDFAPAIFRSGQAGDQSGIATVIRDANNQLVDFTNPLHPNETISIYLTGLSQTAPAATPGDAAPANPLAMVATVPGVTLGGIALPVTFAGLVPGEVGVYQINAYVPAGVPEAVQTPLMVTQGMRSTALQVRVVNP